MDENLIFDVGLHNGEDTAFYLRKGFRVVAVEANSDLCKRAEQRFGSAIQNRRLIVINKAVAEAPGVVKFYRNINESVWGTIDPEWAERNVRLGTRNEETTVEATTMSDLLRQFGVPYYLKVDIEGLDMVAVKGLATVTSRPKYVSIESDKDSFKALRREIQTLGELGYNRFKVVNQAQVKHQKPANPPLEGKYVEHRFEVGASGLFGEEAPGKWLTSEQTIETYRAIFLRYALTGDEPFVRSRIARKVLACIGFRAVWYDTHAKIGGDDY